MAGRKPKPTALKKLEGNPGKRPLNDREPEFRRDVPYCPRHLSVVAKREWHRIVRELYAAGLLTVADRAALAAYCQLYARWVQAEQKLAGGSLTITTDKGFVLQNPLVGICNTALDGMRKYLIEFGMTPSSRSRLHVAPPKKEKSLEELLNEAVSGLPQLPKPVEVAHE
jgi:P27 family predicted phage terminase small subunit